MDLKHLNRLLNFGAHHFNFVDYFAQRLYVLANIFDCFTEVFERRLIFLNLTLCVYFSIYPS